MSELRWDPLKNSWVIMTLGHSRRPQEFLQKRQEDCAAGGFDYQRLQMQDSNCPLCSGNEGRTPPEILACRPQGSAPNAPGWQVRVIPNKFPVLRVEGEIENRAEGLYDRMSGIGAHELIIETPDHSKSLADMSEAHITEVLKVYRSRMLDLRRDSRLRYIFIFKNHGVGTSARISHAHSQLMAVPLVPPLISNELEYCRRHFQHKERCLICDLIHQEQQNKSRIVRDDGNFLVYAPYASRFPFELMIAPLAHHHDFTQQSDQQLRFLARTLRDILRRLRSALRDPAYSLILHSAPPRHPRMGRPDYWESLPFDYHWHIELAPKLTRLTGFEWGSGFHINPTPPEEAAEFLRSAEPEV
ncbi:MAG: galactose-1-phosphate uridylyltransferase [Desulfuromonadales bacterium]|nr:galactose-1-phosphate uridylyltransferase [Desulfuromonadales bacterium]